MSGIFPDTEPEFALVTDNLHTWTQFHTGYIGVDFVGFRVSCDVSLFAMFLVIQTEAERRRREAGVQQAMENGLRSCT